MNFPRSAYIHIPFCHRRCFYCDFPIVALGDKARGDYGPGSSLIKSYLKLLYKEIAMSPEAPPLSTIYIGGGTPSLLRPYQISDLLQQLREHFGIQPGAEISIEVDPASFNQKDLFDFLESGINRLSLGAQSFDNNVLQKIGRRHKFDQLIEACDWINDLYKKGNITSWSLDLIQNIPDENIQYWREQLQQAIEISPPHLSIYDLSIEHGTVFDWRNRRGELNLIDDEASAEMSRLTNTMLKNAGFARYEISNFALPGHASRHNRVYWSGLGWWGFGQGATSCLWGKRFNRPRKSIEYKNWLTKQIEEGLNEALLFSNQYLIDFEDALLTGLRTREGVNFKDLSDAWGWDDCQRESFLNKLKTRWDTFIQEGLVRCIGDRIFLSNPDGMNLSNQILVQMILWWESLPKDAVSAPTLSKLL